MGSRRFFALASFDSISSETLPLVSGAFEWSSPEIPQRNRDDWNRCGCNVAASRRGPLEAHEASASKKRQLLPFERTIVEPQHIRLFHTVPMFADPGQLAGARVRLDYRVQQAVQ